MNSVSSDWVSFGPFRLSSTARVLERDGVRVAIGSRALDILIALVEHAGEIVTQRALIARAWRSLVVDSANLRVQIASLRRTLDDGKQGARYIANVPGQGYCFVAPISAHPAVQLPELRDFLRTTELLRELGKCEQVLVAAAALAGSLSNKNKHRHPGEARIAQGARPAGSSPDHELRLVEEN